MNKSTRHNARRYALQALYQWHYTDDEPEDLILSFMEDNLLTDTDPVYFNQLVMGTISNVEQLDEEMQVFMDRKISALNPVELCILRLAIYELLYSVDVPYKVVIDEALELAKEFGASAGYKYVNAILDAIAKKLRKTKEHGV